MLSVNLRHLEEHDAVLHGELPAAELDMDTRDTIIRIVQPLQYDLRIQKMEDGLLVRGTLQLMLDCRCVRCLKPFERKLELNPWTRHLPLEGEDRATVAHDCVDLTTFVREDMLLELPQHPLCKPDCSGLQEINTGKAPKTGDGTAPLTWAELDKLKL